MASAGAATCGVGTERRVRRLSASEYSRSIFELTGAAPFPLSSLDPVVHGFDDNADALSITTGNFEDFTLSAELTAKAVDVAKLAPCAPASEPAACARDFAASFAERAFGRLPSAGELGSFLQLYTQASALDGYHVGVRTLIQAVLMSPSFLYRTELGPEGAEDEGPEVTLSAEETANALAFALTGQRPDAALLARVRESEGAVSREVLSEQARRLAATDAAKTQWERFLRSLFGVVDLRAVNKIPAYFPSYTPEIKAALDTEVSLFFARALGSGGGTLNAILGAPSTFANQLLFSTLYLPDYLGVEAPAVPSTGEFVELPFNPSLRRGLLGTAAWLAGHSPVHRSSPVDRGLAVRSRLFCLSLEPPKGVAIGQPGGGDADGTTRNKFERHSQDPVCQSCHKFIDPIGFGLEMMDATGRYREADGAHPVDSSGALSGTDVDGLFRGPAELAERLMQSQQVRACFVTQLFRFMEGRDERPEDSCELSPLQQYFADPSRTFPELAVEMVLRPRFALRRRAP